MVKAKEIEGLECRAGAAQEMRLVLLTRLGEVCEHRAAALDRRGEDGVHDMRVGSRRLRSVLRDFRTHMRGGKRVEEARAELKGLADALGAVRDEDVAIRALEKLKGEAEGDAAAGLELLADERRARREGALDRLASALDEEAFDAARRRLASAFEKATVPRKSKGGEGEQCFGDLGRQIIARSREELRERGPDIYRPLKTKRLHKLRIAAKRLRYASELFAACFGEGLKGLAHELAGLQKALGELHDCDEWIKECGQFLSESAARGVVGKSDEASARERREAAFLLLEHFLSKRGGHYTEALAIWRGWEQDDFGSRLAESLREGKRQRASRYGEGKRQKAKGKRQK